MKKRITALIVLIASLVSLLTSCSDDAKSLIEKADKALLNTAYKLEVSADFSCDSYYYEDIFKASSIDFDVYVDRNKYQMDLSVMGVNMDITIIDSTAYYEMEALGQKVKMKSSLDDKQMEELMGESAMEFSPLSFKEITIEKRGIRTALICKSLDSQELEKYIEKTIDEYETIFKAANISLEVSDINFNIILDADGKYEDITLSMKYTFNVSGKNVEVLVNMEYEFEYDESKRISPPSDSYKYEEVDFDDIF